MMQIAINGDQHEFAFAGPAADLVDSTTFSSGTAGLSAFPSEPVVAQMKAGAVPGHLGQAWIGGTASQFFTVTEATIQLRTASSLEIRSSGHPILERLFQDNGR